MNHLVIGDIHGCGRELAALVEMIEAAYRPESSCLVLLGDLFTKGPAPELVVREIRRLRKQGWRIELVCGNHEIRLLGAIGRLRGGVE
ncbi:MAG: metallophosphoesterase, partial [Planctomycetota bacterium]|nr:metallophosphoesterase [Planctomycetota bacterium]